MTSTIAACRESISSAMRCHAVEAGDLPKGRRAGESRHQVARGGAAILVEDGERNVVQIEGRGVAEDDQLDQRRADQHDAALGVLQDGQKLLHDQGEDHGATCRQSSRLRAISRAAPRKTDGHDRQRRHIGQDHRPHVAGEKHRLQNGDEIARRN